MKLEDLLRTRSENQCELCTQHVPLSLYEVQPARNIGADGYAFLCNTCIEQLDRKSPVDVSRWQILSTTMWNENAAVQVLAWRMLNRLKSEAWAADQLEMLYLDEENLAWAQALGDADADVSSDLFHRDSNGNLLQNGDTVVLTQTLDVKGSTIKARVGTVVKNIRLVPDNHEQIEGRIEGQLIVILTKYLRKQMS